MPPRRFRLVGSRAFGVSGSMKVVGCNRLHGRQVPWSTIKRKRKKWSILYKLHSGRSPKVFDWTGLAADYTSRILRLVPASGAFRIPDALGRPGGKSKKQEPSVGKRWIPFLRMAVISPSNTERTLPIKLSVRRRKAPRLTGKTKSSKYHASCGPDRTCRRCRWRAAPRAACVHDGLGS